MIMGGRPQFQVRCSSTTTFSPSCSCGCSKAFFTPDATVHLKIPTHVTPPRGISSSSTQIQLGFRRCLTRSRRGCPTSFSSIHRPLLTVYCKSSPADDDDDDGDYLLASLLIPETVAHYRMRRQGFKEEGVRWNVPYASNKPHPFGAVQAAKEPNAGTLGIGFLRRFPSPTIFLKVSCDGDFLLPIIVGEFAIEKLMGALRGDDTGDCPDQYQLVLNVAGKLGYEVKMVRITQRVVNTYFARLYFVKPGGSEVLSVDARPSDAINVANQCKVPIYVNKEIVFMDAIRISYGMGRVRDTKPTYDVSLDSAVEGPDSLTEELNLVRNMNLAVKEERYHDAALWRDKLMELRKLRSE